MRGFPSTIKVVMARVGNLLHCSGAVMGDWKSKELDEDRRVR